MTDNFDQAMYDEAIQRMESALSQVSEFHMSFDTVWLEFISDHGKEYAQFVNEAWEIHTAKFREPLNDDDDDDEFTPSDSFLTVFHNLHAIGPFKTLSQERFHTEYVQTVPQWCKGDNVTDYAELFIKNNLNILCYVDEKSSLKQSLLIAFDNLLKPKIAKVKEVYESISATETNKDFHYGCRDYFQTWLLCKDDDKPMQFPYEDE